MVFMEVAIAAIGIGIVVMVGYLVIANVKSALPTPQVTNTCLNQMNNGSVPACTGLDNTSATIDDSGYVTGIDGTQTTIYAGFALVAVGIIVLAAFGLIAVFK